MYIVSMCVSDTISAILSPLYLNKVIWGFNEWKIPSLLCKVVAFIGIGVMMRIAVEAFSNLQTFSYFFACTRYLGKASFTARRRSANIFLKIKLG